MIITKQNAKALYDFFYAGGVVLFDNDNVTEIDISPRFLWLYSNGVWYNLAYGDFAYIITADKTGAK